MAFFPLPPPAAGGTFAAVMATSIVPETPLNDGRSIPQLGFGMWQTRPEEVTLSVTTALDAGYRHIDTAWGYHNESELGEVVRESGFARRELFITTKLWNSEHGYDKALAAFDTSLDLLGMDYVDLYLIHWPLPMFDKYVETWKALVRLREEGRAKSIGVSNFNAEHIERIIGETGVAPAVNQVELHPDFAQKPLREFHKKHGIATEAWSPLGGTWSPANGVPVLKNPLVAEVAKRHGKTPAQVIIRWHLQNGIIVIPKSVTPERIRENFNVFDFALTPADLADLDTLDTGERLGPDPLKLDLLHI
ncbi:MAG: aldo/keto reductase [Puniceicoccales bacterium]|nr:aldo/keto reductase [Puniceicoccales bacterium]